MICQNRSSKFIEKKGCILEVREQPYVVNPLTAAYGKTGKPRLVLDCRQINQYLIQFKFKYEDVHTAKVMFGVGSFLFSFDLKGAYEGVSKSFEPQAFSPFR